MPYKVEFSKRALLEIDEAYEWYELQTSGLGNEFIFKLDKTIDKLTTSPTHYGFIDESKTIRDLLLSPFPYLVVYEVINQSVLIHSVFQAQQHPNKKFK
jgi:plasmid stabilization system protein ParE